MSEITIRPVLNEDREWVKDIITQNWESAIIVTRGCIHHPDQIPGFIGELEKDRVGLITYRIYDQECEIVTLNALIRGKGIGTALLAAVRKEAEAVKCRKIWLITTNDNTEAVRFYQKKGFYLVAVHRDTIKQSRQLKPEIPLIGNDGIPIRDEIELALPL